MPHTCHSRRIGVMKEGVLYRHAAAGPKVKAGHVSSTQCGLLGLGLLAAFLHVVVAAPVETLTCPVVVSSTTSVTCGASCQEATCEALATLFRSTNYKASDNLPGSWHQQQGWLVIGKTSCSQLIADSGGNQAPAYCSWYGVTCCTVALRNLGHCFVTNSVWGLQLTVNGLTGSVESLQFQQSFAQLHACGLMSMNLRGNALSGSLTSFWGQLSRLILLDLGKNRIHGTIPDSLRNATMLMKLMLDGNPMHGTIPEWVSELHSLRLLSLSASTGYNSDGRRGFVGTIPASISSMQHLERLVFRSNSLTGTLPPGICQNGMLVLDLKGNALSGDIGQLFFCASLRYLDISSNRFSGSLPDIPFWNWPNMSTLYLSNNDFEGRLPAALYKLPRLFILKLAHNRLSGTISRDIRRMPLLMEIDLSHNQLAGRLDESFWYIPCLAAVDLSYNKLTGTLSDAVGSSFFLQTVHLDGNQLTGLIPPNIALARGLMSFSLMNTPMSCNTGDGRNVSRVCDKEDLLPCFLQLSPVLLPRPDASYMECPVITRKPTSEVIRDCQGTKATQVGVDASGDRMELEVEQQVWSLDPGYYQYQGCRCLGGYMDVWNTEGTVLTCVPVVEATPTWVVPTAASIGAIGIIILVVVALLAWFRFAMQYRKKWQREKELLQCKQKGVPVGGPASIVVTDVEGYSELMRVNAGPATQAMGIHNAILRKAVAAHAGHVIEQEGDSWSVAFHRAVDAVAFCLQVQQALQKSQWPPQLSAKSSSEKANCRSMEVSGNSPGTTIVGSSSSHNNSYQGGSAQSAHGLQATGNSGEHGVLVRLLQRLTRAGGKGNKQDDCGPSTKSTGNGCVRAGSVDLPRRASLLGLSAGGYLAGTAVASRATSVVSVAGPGRADHDAGGTSSKAQQMENLINGLRVRMGIASGLVPSGTDITRSILFGMAKAVSDMANGGQILMDSGTAAEAREALPELGGVDHKGYNDELLSVSLMHSKRPLHNAVRRLLSAVLRPFIHSSQLGREPLLLHMGQFWVPSISSCCVLPKPLAMTKDVGSTRVQDAHLGKITAAAIGVAEGCSSHKESDSTTYVPALCSRASLTAAAVATLYGVSAVDAYNKLSLHLYSVVAQPLHARSKIWLNHINMTQGAQQMSKSYFSAPGTITADLSPGAGFLERPVLPSVTLVFAAVDDGRMLVKKNEQVAAYLHKVLLLIMQASLMCFPDGYLYHTDQAELKYMLAFDASERAAEWALLLQDVLQHVPWPPSLLAALTARTRALHAGEQMAVEDNASDQQWPGLKMGLANGVPDSLLPNHHGHAEYSGSLVCLADAIVSTAARPGQILMADELAKSLIRTWQQLTDADKAPKQHCTPTDTAPQVPWPVLSAKDMTVADPSSTTTGLLEVDPSLAISNNNTETPALPVGKSVSGGVHKQSTSDHTAGAPPPDSFLLEAPEVAANNLETQQGSNMHAVAVYAAAESYETADHMVYVIAQPIGRFTFRRSGVVKLINLASDAVPGCQGTEHTRHYGAKVSLPKVLPVFQDAWERLAAVEPMHTAAVVLGEGTLHTGRHKRSKESKTRTITATADY